VNRDPLRRWRAIGHVVGGALLVLAPCAIDAHASRRGFDARPVAAADATDPDAVRAAFLYLFAARHVKWPESAHAGPTTPFLVGVLGKDPIVSELVATCRGRKVGDHPIEVRVLDDAASAAGVHLLFVPGTREAELPAVLTAVKSRAVLVVASSEDAVRKGAHLGFFVEKSKVKFAADPDAPKRVGLEVSSEVLKLARVIVKKAAGGG
jgi:hypothetical protein